MFYKVLAADGSCFHGGVGSWPLPAKKDGTWTPGEWLKVEGALVVCRNALHLCRESDLLKWLGPLIYEAEYRGEVIEAEDKIVVREARLLRRMEGWNRRTARLFACDCAERVLHLYERRYPGDRRPRKAIEVARKYANGQATGNSLPAAWDAAWYAALDAAWAARAAALAAGDATWEAARDAARAASDAAKAAAWEAVWDARAASEAAKANEYKWQTARLMEYLSYAEEEG